MELKTVFSNPKTMEQLLNTFSEGLYLTRPDGLTLYVNKAYEEITGIPAQQVVGRYMRDIVSEGTLMSTITKDVVDSGAEITAEQRTKDNRALVIHGKPILDEKGRVALVFTTVRDMSVLDKMQKDIDKYRSIADDYKSKLEAIEKRPKFVAKSASFKRAVDLAHKVANIDSTVLITGESGTGKEIIAREIHENSHRVKGEFIKLNCGAIPENLLESELFGYEKGAFTGAAPGGHIGVFEQANRGTILLDEIGELPLVLQVKLLRVLQEKVVTRLGSDRARKVDVRIIAATNENLETMIEEKRFRKDLYFRLNVVQIHTPPLRQRKEEIPFLVEYFVEALNQKYRMHKSIHPDVVQNLMLYDWPGNVRELENTVERLMVTSEADVITQNDTGVQLNDMLRQTSQTPQKVFTLSGIVPLKTAQLRLEEYLLREAQGRFRTTYQIAKALDISQPSASRKLGRIAARQEEE